MNEATIRVPVADADAAKQLVAALGPDNDDTLAATAEGATVVLRARGATRMGLLRSLDDAMSCLRAAGVP